MLLSGVGLCVAGFWVAPLLIPGGALLAGALGFWQSAFVVDAHEHGIELQPIAPVTNNYSYDDHRQVNMLFMYDNHRLTESRQLGSQRALSSPERLTLI